MEKPLVSIIVITYNSSKYVIETLESIKIQTYKNIELIISDDCSSDGTVEICNSWLIANIGRFVRTKLITVEKNTGIPSNCNRGLYESKGEWIKLIAGDDTLESNCIEVYVTAVCNDKKKLILHSDINEYHNSFIIENFIKRTNFSSPYFQSEDISANEQYNILLRGNFISAATTFFHKSIFNYSFFDEDMPYEDWPMWIKLAGRGFKFHYLNVAVVNYRRHYESMYNQGEFLVFNDFFIKKRFVYNHYVKNHLFFLERFNEDFEYCRKIIFKKFKLNQRNTFSLFINNLFVVFYNINRKYFLKKYTQFFKS